MKTRLLVVEDDLNLGDILSEYLTLKGYSTKLCRDGEEGAIAFRNDDYDMCILDLMMPKKDGFTLAKEIRAINVDVPIIFLTAKSLKQDVLKGFKIGGDDYIIKPFSMEELLYRIQVILKRSKSQTNSEMKEKYEVNNLTFHPHYRKLITSKQEYHLTTKENELLKILFQNLNNTVTRTGALLRVWKDDTYFNSRSMDVYITKIRKYLADEPTIKLQTVHGEGFKLLTEIIDVHIQKEEQ